MIDPTEIREAFLDVLDAQTSGRAGAPRTTQDLSLLTGVVDAIGMHALSPDDEHAILDARDALVRSGVIAWGVSVRGAMTSAPWIRVTPKGRKILVSHRAKRQREAQERRAKEGAA